MSWTNPAVLQATSRLCGSGGSMPLPRLHQELLQRCNISEEDFIFIIKGCERFLLVRGPAGDYSVVARTSLRLCRSYGRKEPCESCQHLHLCKFFIYGTCRFGKGRYPCKFSHDVHSDHNYKLLRECTLQDLKEEELFLLLLQNDPTLLPEVCLHYNKGSGPHGNCTFQENCTKVHLCRHFVQGDCMFGNKCKRQHVVDEGSRRMLEERGLSRDIINNLPFIYRNVHHIAAAGAGVEADSSCKSAQAVETREICLHFIRNSCKFHENCRRVHFRLPYKWEVLDNGTWTDLEDMEDIERDFCDPAKTHSGFQPVDFLSMTCGSLPVRRLSTISSVTKPPHYSLTTQWLWYYKGDQGSWVEYGQLDDKQRSTSATSHTLEEAFLSDGEAEVKVVKGQRQYIISFTDMYQRNPKHKTKRKVRRRPRFVSMAEVDRLVAEQTT
ncbi:protein mono-ADP-ribosyltransferase PARP12b isoform X2 [Melanotaenia boesemani]|uniref:protein mono-ADP-ribosyltransferase PARP12b isoform X2 n=1 Tax=Melanotaenia boesemani TaxID=1250792 RepID=UPI001C054C64|nr:protein mono-ADP-ribosyltransferase PARP12b isoform X2 [Melanotaenia boesemani]